LGITATDPGSIPRSARSVAVLRETATTGIPLKADGTVRSRSQVTAATGTDASWNAVAPKRWCTRRTGGADVQAGA